MGRGNPVDMVEHLCAKSLALAAARLPERRVGVRAGIRVLFFPCPSQLLHGALTKMASS